MTTSQQKLKMKMMSIDTWSIREQLSLASSVLRSGDQNWVSVSRSLRTYAEPNRPQDWLSPKNCALQYNSLLEKTGAHKRKRGERHPSSGPSELQQGETAGEIILKQLTQERIEELQQLVESSRREYDILRKKGDLIQEGKLDDKLQEMCKKIDEENESKLLEQSAHLKWLEERERKKEEIQAAFKQQMRERPSPVKTNHSELEPDSPSLTDQLNIDVTTEEVPETKTAGSSSVTPVAATPTPSSPLLTSLLRSPTSSTGPPSATKSLSSPVPSKLNISLTSPNGISSGLKSLLSTAIGDDSSSKVTSSTSTTTTAPTLTRLLDLPLSSPGKPLPELAVAEETEVTTSSNSQTKSKDEMEEALSDSTTAALEKIKEELLECIPEELQKEGVVQNDQKVTTASKLTNEPPLTIEEVSAVIKELDEINHDEREISTAETETAEVAEVTISEETVEVEESQAKEESVKEEIVVAVESEIEVEESVEKSVEESVLESTEPTELMTTVVTTETVFEEQVELHKEDQTTTEEDKTEIVKEDKLTDITEVKPKTDVESPMTRRPLRVARRGKASISGDTSTTATDDKPKLNLSSSAEIGPTTRRSSGRSSKSQTEEVEGDGTASEMPELVEPSTTNVVKRKVPPPPLPLLGPSLSPAPSSGIDSVPNSPTSSVSTVTDDDREYKAWKKSILLMWREISSHKNASLFQKPITEEHVPGYRDFILRPMDLSTIKKNLESGVIRTTAEFHRDITLMFLNSIIFNPTTDDVYRMAKEMFAETNVIIQEFMNAQLLAQNLEIPRPHRRETRDFARRTESLSSHEETPSKPEEGKTRASKRASIAAALVDDTKKRRSRAAVSTE